MTQTMPGVSEPMTPLHEPHDWVSMEVDKLGKALYNSEAAPLSEQIRRLKTKTICEALHNGKLDEVVAFSRSTDGLISNELRRKIWPLLLGVEEPGRFGDEALVNDLAINDNPLHKDEDQVKLDIKRSFTILNHVNSVAFAFTSVYSTDEIAKLKKNLYALVVRLLRKYPSLHYYQGFHDVASVVLLVCFHQNTGKFDQQLAFKILEALTINHLRDFMITDVNLSLVHLRLIPALLEITDYRFFKLIKQLNNSYVNANGSYYDYNFLQAISSIITLFAHDIENLHQLLVMWDFSLSYGTILINVYIYVAALANKKDEIFAQLGIRESADDFDDVDRDTLHNLISPAYLFKDLTDNDLIKILNQAVHYFENFPINNLSNSSFTYDIWFNEHNPNSVLLTTSASLEESKGLKLINNASKVEELIQLQDQEMTSLTLYTLEIEKKVFEAQAPDELASSTEYEQSFSNALASSLSSLQSSTSSLNTKILRTSSMYFKKLLFSEHKDNDDKSPIKRNKLLKLATIYKLSLTVGVIGFLVHFLLVKNNISVGNLANKFMRDTFQFLKESHFINNGFQAGQVGLGTLRNSFFGYSG